MSDQKTAVILVNLGTPDAPTTSAVRRYLKQFLADPRVVETPRLIWYFVLRLVILPLRPRRVAKLYASIWEKDSPIRLISESQAVGVGERLGVTVRYAMSYGHPGFETVLDELVADGHERLVILPLYPQYSGSTTGSVADALARWMTGRREVPSVSLIKDYWQHPAWQQAVAGSIRDYRERHGDAEKLLFSFHGIPVSYENRGDRYGERCRLSADAVIDALELPAHEWAMTFQSRFGPQEWLNPYTDKTLQQWAADGVRSVQVVCPGFSADCLETLEEINSENRELFLAAGGERFEYIPALNDQPVHLDALAEILRPHLL
ncbi:ferrochelatase [Alloalcanivorax mobilis]|uniref:ferrochelatase n=1 Tax=Alloalcanivorax mobilis TaxID=2019569 RepID=UPI000C76C024|nr:ferrochelatase [Alloalcanivorax mobilis]